MKKIMIIIVAVLMGINANAQCYFTYEGRYDYFTFGDYKSKCTSVCSQEKGGGFFMFYFDDSEEKQNFYNLVKYNTEDIEKKYNVTIKYLNEYRLGDCRVLVEIYDTDTYNKYIKAKEEESQERERAKQTRMENLNKIL